MPEPDGDWTFGETRLGVVTQGLLADLQADRERREAELPCELTDAETFWDTERAATVTLGGAPGVPLVSLGQGEYRREYRPDREPGPMGRGALAAWLGLGCVVVFGLCAALAWAVGS